MTLRQQGSLYVKDTITDKDKKFRILKELVDIEEDLSIKV